MNSTEIEQAARHAWPALEEQELSFGVLRYASGSDRRANSLSLYPRAHYDACALIEAAEKFFGQRSTAPIVRLVRTQDSSVAALAGADQALASRGYEKQSPTLTMLLDMTDIAGQLRRQAAGVKCADDLSSWLQAWYALTGKAEAGMAIHETILAKLEPSKLLLLRHDVGGQHVATGMAVLSSDAAGLFGVATAAEYRQRGYAQLLVKSLLGWAVEQGARFAYLQVEESNEAAIRLYRGLGFTVLYSYWYRVGKQFEEAEGVVG